MGCVAGPPRLQLRHPRAHPQEDSKLGNELCVLGALSVRGDLDAVKLYESLHARGLLERRVAHAELPLELLHTRRLRSDLRAWIQAGLQGWPLRVPEAILPLTWSSHFFCVSSCGRETNSVSVCHGRTLLCTPVSLLWELRQGG